MDPVSFNHLTEVILGVQITTMPKTQFLAYTAVFSALLAVFSFIRVPMPPPLYSVSLFTLGIYTVAVLFGPYIGFLAGAIGGALAEMTAPKTSALFVISAFVAKGAGGLVIGYLRSIAKPLSRLNPSGTATIVGESFALVIGRFVELAIFFAIDAQLHGFGPALTDFMGLVTLVFAIPVGAIVNAAMRKGLRRQYFDRRAA
jgi:uncharacterized membrane protein